MLWKIYFVVITILFVLSLPTLFSSPALLRFGDIRGLFEFIILLVGLAQYIFKKKILKRDVWGIIFWYLTIAWTLDILYVAGSNQLLRPLAFFFEVNTVPVTPAGVIFSIVASLPALYAIHKLAYGKK